MTDPLVTITFTIPPSAYIRVFALRLAARWWTVVALPIIGLFALAWWLSDLRWAILALMLLMVVWPMILLPWTLNRLTTLQAEGATLPRQVTVVHDREYIISYPDSDRPPHHIPWADTGTPYRSGPYCVIPLHTRALPILIPLTALKQ